MATVLLGPEAVFTLAVNAEAPPKAASTHQRKFMLGDAIFGSEVRDLESRILGNSRDLMQLEFGDLCRNEREEDEQGEVLHGHRVVVEGGQEHQLGSNL